MLKQGLRKGIWESFLAGIHTDIGLVFAEQGNRAEALEAYRRAEAIYKTKLATQPMDAPNLLSLALIQLPIGGLLWESGDHEGALTKFRDSITSLRQQSSNGANKNSLASALGILSWYCLLKQEFSEAKAAATEGYSLDQQRLWILINKAHAEMFLNNLEDAIAIHTQNRNSEIVKNGTVKGWKVVVQEDFDAFKKAGLVNQHMAYIENMLTRE